MKTQIIDFSQDQNIIELQNQVDGGAFKFSFEYLIEQFLSKKLSQEEMDKIDHNLRIGAERRKDITEKYLMKIAKKNGVNTIQDLYKIKNPVGIDRTTLSKYIFDLKKLYGNI